MHSVKVLSLRIFPATPHVNKGVQGNLGELVTGSVPHFVWLWERNEDSYGNQLWCKLIPFLL